MCVFPLFSLGLLQYSAKLVTVLRRLEASGNNDPETFWRFIGKEQSVGYMFILFRDKGMDGFRQPRAPR